MKRDSWKTANWNNPVGKNQWVYAETVTMKLVIKEKDLKEKDDTFMSCTTLVAV